MMEEKQLNNQSTERPSRSIGWRIFKISLITLISFVLLIVAALAITYNIMVTPERVTPIINHEVGRVVDGEASIGSIDLTIISTFPKVSVKIDSLVVRDSLQRTLAEVAQLRVTVDPMKYLESKALHISEMVMVAPNMTIARGADGKTNLERIFSLEFVYEDEEVEVEVPDSLQFRLRDHVSSIQIDRLAIEEGSFRVMDRITQRRAMFDGVNFELLGKLNDSVSMIDMSLGCEKINYIREGMHLVNDLRIATRADVKLDRIKRQLLIIKGDLTVGKISLKSSGTLRVDTLEKALATDLRFNLEAQSLSKIIASLSKKYIAEGETFSADGAMVLGGSINGFYNPRRDRMPNFDLNFAVNDGRFKFDNMPYGVDTLSVAAHAMVYGDSINSSRVELTRMRAYSEAGIDINSKAFVYDPLGVCRLFVDIDSYVDITKLRDVLPLAEGIELNGRNNTKIVARMSKDNILNQDYGAIYLRGESRFKDVQIEIDGSKLADTTLHSAYLYSEMDEAVFNFGSERLSRGVKVDHRNIAADVLFKGVAFKDRFGRMVNMSNVNLKAASQITKDSTKVTPISGDLTLDFLEIDLPDTLYSKVTRSNVIFSAKGWDQDQSKGSFSFQLKADTLNVDAIATKTKFGMNQAAINMTLEPDSLGRPRRSLFGSVGFVDLKARSELFPLDIALDRSLITLRKSRFELFRTHMTVGESDFTATGWIYNLLPRLFNANDKLIEAELSLNSDFINLNELLNASTVTSELLLQSAEVEDAPINEEVVATDSIQQVELLKVPRRMRADFDVNLNRVRVLDHDIEGIQGCAKVRHGVLSLDSLRMLVQGSEMKVSALYEPLSDSVARSLIDFRAENVVLENMINMFPSVDSLMPPLKSVKGVVDFDTVVKGQFDSSMTLKLPTLESVMNFTGHDLVLMDSETFEDIAKMLKFKNRDRNIIDSLNMNIVVTPGGRVDVPPFELAMDRYVAILGGTQMIDFSDYSIDYKYNISVTKSPILIKLGVDITGKNEDFKYKVTKAKLKKSDFKGIQNRVDELQQELREEMVVQKRVFRGDSLRVDSLMVDSLNRGNKRVDETVQ